MPSTLSSPSASRTRTARTSEITTSLVRVGVVGVRYRLCRAVAAYTRVCLPHTECSGMVHAILGTEAADGTRVARAVARQGGPR
eukprot:2278755-Rhodomonas_salina.1